VVPYLLFLATTFVGAELLGDPPLLYPVKAALVGGVVLLFYRAGCYPELTLRPSLLAVAAGLGGFALWVLPEPLLSPLALGRSSYDPRAAGEAYVVPLAAARIAGATLVVPLFEELFLRSFLMRYLDAVREDREDFREIPIGRYRLASFLGVVVVMAVTHHRWLRAGLYSAMLNLLLYREKRLGPVIWAHAVTNLALGIYVVVTGEWSFW
jgi:CAAX prenyl protease-like protein